MGLLPKSAICDYKLLMAGFALGNRPFMPAFNHDNRFSI